MATVPSTEPARFAELKPPLDRASALAEADRCLECGGFHAEAPCIAACPAGIDVPRFVAEIARDNRDEAARVIFAENLLGGTCARVCPVELLCEGACVLLHEGRAPVDVARLQRYATDGALDADTPLRDRAPYNWLRIAVIGAGPAGLTCAGELASLGYDVTVYDERLEPGGLARYAIAPYRLDREPLPQEARVLKELGVHFELGIDIDTREALESVVEDADAVVLAVGMGPDADVRYPGDDLPGVWESLPFIEALKLGVPPFVGESVAVIGGGNTAVDVAREARLLGADHVRMLYRRTRDEMPAYSFEIEEAEAEGVEVLWLTLPVRFIGGDRVQAVECLRAELGEPDTDGRRRPHEIPGSEFVLPVDTVVKAIGQRPRAEFLSWIDGLELDGGRILVDAQTGQTGNPRFFAAGDACNGGATVVEAVREGKLAARGVHEWLDRGWA
jgi:dihydropyrimidine dehydrogenase (NAD+) subunit PreT